jgi:hypothetical protein
MMLSADFPEYPGTARKSFDTKDVATWTRVFCKAKDMKRPCKGFLTALEDDLVYSRFFPILHTKSTASHTLI